MSLYVVLFNSPSKPRDTSKTEREGERERKRERERAEGMFCELLRRVSKTPKKIQRPLLSHSESVHTYVMHNCVVPNMAGLLNCVSFWPNSFLTAEKRAGSIIQFF
jgi:hypothetical protein